MPTLNSWGNQILDANVTLNGGTCNIGSDATSGAINIGTGAAARTTTLGNVTGATAVNINTGTGGSSITTTNGTFAVSTGTGAVNIGTDAVAKTVTVGNDTGATSVVLNCGTGALNLGSNAIARTTTLGNTTGASVLALKYGTGDFTLASATGTVMSAIDTGELTYPLQPSFLAYPDADRLNVTGNGAKYGLICNTELYDRNADYNTGTGAFVAPVAGVYHFSFLVRMVQGGAVNYTNLALEKNGTEFAITYTDLSNGSYVFCMLCAYNLLAAGDSILPYVTCSGTGGNTMDIFGTQAGSTFAGHLVC